MTVPALLARIRSAADAEMGLMLTPDDVIVLDAEVFRLGTQGDIAYNQGYTDGQDDERAAVVEWLRDPSTSPYIGVLAYDIDYGEHRRKVKP